MNFTKPFDEIEVSARDLFSNVTNGAPRDYRIAYPLPLNNYGDYKAITLSPRSDIRDVALWIDGETNQPYPLISSDVCLRSDGWERLAVSTWYPAVCSRYQVTDAAIAATVPADLRMNSQKLVLRLWRFLPASIDRMPSTMFPLCFRVLTNAPIYNSVQILHLPGVDRITLAASNNNVSTTAATVVELNHISAETADNTAVTYSQPSFDALVSVTLPTVGDGGHFSASAIHLTGSDFMVVLKAPSSTPADTTITLWAEYASAR